MSNLFNAGRAARGRKHDRELARQARRDRKQDRRAQREMHRGQDPIIAAVPDDLRGVAATLNRGGPL